MNKHNASFPNLQVPNLNKGRKDTEYFYGFVFRWADEELKHLRAIKNQIQREPSPATRHMLEIQLSARVNRYISIVSSVTREIRKDKKIFRTLSPELQAKVSGWARGEQ